MTVENTDLERRVLAHERILQALIAQLAETDPTILDRLKIVFTELRQQGAYEQDYTDTAAYAEQFVHQVSRLSLPRPSPNAAAPATTDQPLPLSLQSHLDRLAQKGAGPTIFRTTTRGGVWHVTRDHSFYGDYHARQQAVDAAYGAARTVEALGGAAEVQVYTVDGALEPMRRQ